MTFILWFLGVMIYLAVGYGTFILYCAIFPVFRRDVTHETGIMWMFPLFWPAITIITALVQGFTYAHKFAINYAEVLVEKIKEWSKEE